MCLLTLEQNQVAKKEKWPTVLIFVAHTVEWIEFTHMKKWKTLAEIGELGITNATKDF